METPTLDPFVVIEEQRVGYTRYRRADGLRWEIVGVCDHRRDCMVGAVVDDVLVESVEQARALPTPELDCPVGPGFRDCCPLEVIEL